MPESLEAVADACGLPIAEIERVAAPDPAAFTRQYESVSRPVILTGLTGDWLRPDEWTPRRLSERHGSARVLAAAIANGALLDEPGTGVIFRHVSLAAFVASLERGEAVRNYVMAPTGNFSAQLQEEYRVPAYCRDAAHLRIKVWVGGANTVTPTHRDVPHNLHVHLHGRKRWLLFAPGQSRHLYPRGLFSGMPNFANVDPERPDYARYPAFRGAAIQGAVLEPGETLFIPHGWWHHTRSLDNTVAMNFWYGGAVIQCISFASTLFKKVTGIRRNEWR